MVHVVSILIMDTIISIRLIFMLLLDCLDGSLDGDSSGCSDSTSVFVVYISSSGIKNEKVISVIGKSLN